jgi:tetratricopeptide (TPR) repeat protein
MADTQYDLGTGMIRLVRASDCGEQAAVAWAAGEPFAALAIEPIRGNQRHVAGTGSINGVSLRVVFDTGAPTTLLSLDAARRAGLAPGQPGVMPAGVANGLGGAVAESWLAPSASYSIGGRDIRGDPLRIADMGAVPFDLLIGADFFLAHRVYVAHSRGRLYFASVAGQGSLPSLADAAAYGRRGSELAIRGDLANAIADFTRAIELAPNEPRYLVQRSKARLDAKQELLARHDLDQAIALKPDMIEARLARAVLLVAQKNAGSAKQDLAAAAAASPPEADYRLFIASVYVGIEEWQASREQFDLWARHHPADPRLPVALNASCWAGAMLNQQLDRALADCNQAIAKAPAAFEMGDSRGLVWLRMGRFAEAIADYDAVLARQPDFPWSLFGRGLAKLRTGRAAEGRADIAAALRIDPDIANKARRIGLISSTGDPR